MSLLRVRGLSRDFDGLRAVDGVDLDIDTGEVRALIGPNGAGKTTLVGMIAGRIAPGAGHVIFDGQDITRLPAHRRMRLGMAYTFQITSVFAGLPVAENVALAARRQARGAALGRAVATALDRVGLRDRADEMAGDLAYGHQRLLEIAMGIAQRPRLLILDEPTQGLAEGEIAGFARLVRALAAETTILLIEHNMDVVMALADRITVMDAGRVLAEGTPAEIHANAAVQAAYLGGGGDAAAG
jgi:branched-chain amino acid transport system ATP-binding protein